MLHVFKHLREFLWRPHLSPTLGTCEDHDLVASALQGFDSFQDLLISHSPLESMVIVTSSIIIRIIIMAACIRDDSAAGEIRA